MPLTRSLILQKARRHPPLTEAPTGCKLPISGDISLPSRGTFHHSLTVLSAIGHQGVFRLTTWSWQIHTRFHGPRATWDTQSMKTWQFRLRDYHPLRSTIQDCSPITQIL